MIEIGQLRVWNQDAGLNGEIFLVIGITKTSTSGDRRFVDYLMNCEHCWDNEERLEQHSEVVS